MSRLVGSTPTPSATTSPDRKTASAVAAQAARINRSLAARRASITVMPLSGAAWDPLRLLSDGPESLEAV